MRAMWWIPWSILLTLAPITLYGIWQICGKPWRLRHYLPIALLILHLLFALALTRGFADPVMWLALLLALCWYATLAILPALILGWRYHRHGWPHWLRLTVIATFLALVATSLFNAYQPTVRHTRITLAKPMPQPLRVMLAADLHLYWLFGNREIDWLTRTAQQENIDLILLPGDLINDRLDAYHARNMAAHLAQLRAPLGVYATLGNHEFYGDALANAQALRDAGIHLLRDQAITIADRLVIAGRDDDMQRSRKPLADILHGSDKRLPTIVLDHRPTHLAENAAAGADIQVSGHTHGGQIFPINLIVRNMYRLHHGHAQIDGMDTIVTSGYGFWGIPFRLGTRSEVWIVDISGQ